MGETIPDWRRNDCEEGRSTEYVLIVSVGAVPDIKELSLRRLVRLLANIESFDLFGGRVGADESIDGVGGSCFDTTVLGLANGEGPGGSDLDLSETGEGVGEMTSGVGIVDLEGLEGVLPFRSNSFWLVLTLDFEVRSDISGIASRGGIGTLEERAGSGANIVLRESSDVRGDGGPSYNDKRRIAESEGDTGMVSGSIAPSAIVVSETR
jgi:hypothetical protein